MQLSGVPATRAALRPLVGDLRQLASVRRVVLDDDAERGVRALVFSTGGGLDFWVLADRSLDIGPLSLHGVPVAWQSPAGFRHPGLIEHLDDGGRGVERGFSGMMVTCGLEHLRQPQGGILHGHLPYTPARVTAHGEDWDAATPVLFCEGEVTQFRVGGEALRLHRRIEAPVGGTTLRVRDRVENIGPAPQPAALMYHVNFGFPAIADGSRLVLDGAELMRLDFADPRGVSNHRADGAPSCCVLETGTLRAALSFALPCVQVWRDLRPGVRVLGIEPCTQFPGEAAAALEPGESRDFGIELALQA